MRRAARAGENPLAVVLAAWVLLRREAGFSVDARLHPKRWRQLSRALMRGERYAGGGHGAIGAGAEMLIDALEESADRGWAPLEITCYRLPTAPGRTTEAMNARNAGTTVFSLAHFGCWLDQTTRRDRRRVRDAEETRAKGRRRRAARRANKAAWRAQTGSRGRNGSSRPRAAGQEPTA
ncbi:MAG: hypothetical protein M3P50_12305 [Actinomycetota bacterium]|nr:hypothetical protein [Actinomycetota bacterium]